MHLPDGFLDAKTALLSTGAAAAGVGIALRQVKATVTPAKVPLLGLAASFVFAAQMLNFPVVGGTSGHLMGGVLTAVLLGPSAAVLVMTCVLIVQCLMFADGGLTALGANVFNMGILSVCGGYLVFRLMRRLIPTQETRSTVFAAAFAAWFGTVLASLSCAGQLALSGTAPWSLAFPAMVNIHMLIGVGEGLATGLVTLAVLRARPDLVTGNGPAPVTGRFELAGYGLLSAVGLALFVAPFASSWPDGLEAIAHTLGFEHKAQPAVVPAPMTDYQFPWLGSATTATAAAGLIGTVIAFVGAYVLARLLVPVLSAGKKDAVSHH
ncbi:MAG TPA: energy-coupling factor ABC transporter permease [Clostridia bacterium]|nr:energy-coupling factor ABC transporter permease [Clostridia bacterium]